MEKKSRVKKYEALRNAIESQYDIEQLNSGEEEALRAFDSAILKRAVVQEGADPKHAKTDDEVEPVLQDSFTNEYLDDFMREVREYNIRKGTRSIDSTGLDILARIATLPDHSQDNVVTYVEEEEEYEPRPDDDFRSRDDIVREVEALFQQTLQEDVDIVVESFDLSNEEELVEETFVPSDDEEEEDEALMITDEIPANADTTLVTTQHAVSQTKTKPETKSVTKPVAKPISKPTKSNSEVKKGKPTKKDSPKESVDDVHKELVAETQRIKKSLTHYEAELNDLSSGVEKNNRLLNISLGVLIIALLVIIGFIVYTIYQAGGFGA